MSYDLAVWVGERPPSDREAGRVHTRFYDRYLDGDERTPVNDAIEDLLISLTDRWPDWGTGDDSPWAGTPLAAGASGPYVYLSLSWESADTVSAYVAELAKNLGLVCFDPQQRALR